MHHRGTSTAVISNKPVNKEPGPPTDAPTDGSRSGYTVGYALGGADAIAMGSSCSGLPPVEAGELSTEEQWGKTITGNVLGMRYGVVGYPTKKDQDRWDHYSPQCVDVAIEQPVSAVARSPRSKLRWCGGGWRRGGRRGCKVRGLITSSFIGNLHMGRGRKGGNGGGMKMKGDRVGRW